jgi:hypothetical protein
MCYRANQADKDAWERAHRPTGDELKAAFGNLADSHTIQSTETSMDCFIGLLYLVHLNHIWYGASRFPAANAEIRRPQAI